MATKFFSVYQQIETRTKRYLSLSNHRASILSQRQKTMHIYKGIEMSSDKFDKAIEFLKKNPKSLLDAYRKSSLPIYSTVDCINNVDPKPAFPLFQRIGLDPWGCCGNLIEIRSGRNFQAEWDDLTFDIRHDGRIPRDIKWLNVGNLQVFAEWQRMVEQRRQEIMHRADLNMDELPHTHISVNSTEEYPQKQSKKLTGKSLQDDLFNNIFN